MKWVLFDAYGTLFDAGKYNIREISELIAKESKIPPERIYDLWTTQYIKLERDSQRGFRTITDTNRESLAYVFKLLRIKYNHEKYIQMLTDLWSFPKLNDGVKELMQCLKNQNCIIGIVSNSDENVLHSAIEYNALPIKHYISSEKAKSYKPSPDIFLYATKEWGCTTKDCIYIGNSRDDMISASSAGVKCVIINQDNLFADTNRESNQNSIFNISDISNCYSIVDSFINDDI